MADSPAERRRTFDQAVEALLEFQRAYDARVLDPFPLSLLVQDRATVRLLLQVAVAAYAAETGRRPSTSPDAVGAVLLLELPGPLPPGRRRRPRLPGLRPRRPATRPRPLPVSRGASGGRRTLRHAMRVAARTPEDVQTAFYANRAIHFQADPPLSAHRRLATAADSAARLAG